jgi:autonomous glycyl radical cofactor GrcA
MSPLDWEHFAELQEQIAKLNGLNKHYLERFWEMKMERDEARELVRNVAHSKPRCLYGHRIGVADYREECLEAEKKWNKEDTK